MKKKLLSRAVAAAALEPDLIPGASLIELTDNCRLLIENHLSVVGYSDCNVCIKMKFGSVQIRGDGLIIHKMSREQLVIEGEIHCIELTKAGA